VVDIAGIREVLLHSFTMDGEYQIEDDGRVTSFGNVISRRGMARLPVEFSRIDGDLRLGNTGLVSLENCPKTLGGSLEAQNNFLKTTMGMPEDVGRYVDVSDNPLVNLNGFAKKVGAHVDITLTPTLPLLRLLVAPDIVLRIPRNSGTRATEFSQDRFDIESILDKYAGQGRAAVIDCKRELVAAGFEGNARW